MLRRRLLLCALGLVVTTPVLGQTQPKRDDEELLEQQQQQQQPLPGQVADSAVGRVGQRQTRQQAAPNINPTERISTRINNRLQSRIRNRIDRDYDPQANFKSPFEVAEDNARTGK